MQSIHLLKKEPEMAKKVSGIFFFIVFTFTFLTGCKEDSDPVGPGVSNGVVGTWVDEDGLEYTFNSNGKITGSAIDAVNAIFTLLNLPAKVWTYNATTILIDGQPSSPYTVNNDKLTMKDSQGQDVVLTKK
jgi:hypothetical protein